jgi:hypothetical protein
LAARHRTHIPTTVSAAGRFLKAISAHIDQLIVPDYTTMWWRVTRIKVELDPKVNTSDVVIAVDSTGVKVSNRGEWIRDKWKARRGFVKIHVAIDVKKKKILSMKVTRENVHDGRMLKPLVKQLPNVNRVIADGAYDSKDNFRFLDSIGAEPAIKVRSNASLHAHGCMPRKLVVAEQLKDIKRWKRRYGYGYRWMAETAFSSMKRMFGEYVTSVRWNNTVNKLMLRASIYSTFVNLASA